MKAKFLMTAAVALILTGSAAQAGEDPPMGFFVTSVGMGDGANLGGLDGADVHCTELAEVANSVPINQQFGRDEIGRRGR